MNAQPTPTSPVSTSTGAGTPRTLERDAKVVAAGIVAFLLTALVWKLAWDITAHLAVTYSEKLLALRAPLFLISVVLIWAGAVTYIARVLGKSFRNVVFDERNATMAQWALFGFAVWDATYAARKYLPAEVRSEIQIYSLAIALVIGAAILRAVQKIYGPRGSRDAGRSSYGTVNPVGRGSPLAVAGLALLIAIGLAGVWWVYKAANTIPDEDSGRGRVADAPAPLPTPQPPPTWHGLTGGVEKTLILNGEWSEKIIISPTHKIKWDDAPRNVLMRINETNVGPIWGGRRTNDISVVEFKTKDGAIATIQVATGITVRD